MGVREPIVACAAEAILIGMRRRLPIATDSSRFSSGPPPSRARRNPRARKVVSATGVRWWPTSRPWIPATSTRPTTTTTVSGFFASIWRSSFEARKSFSLLAEIRSDNLAAPRAYALYARFRPWRERDFAIQAGRVPPVFGAFLRRRYEFDNPLIGYPLPYQYPTVLRPDSAPATLGQLLFYRGYGARVRYPLGETSVASGLAQVSPIRWDTGVSMNLGAGPVALALALTQGTISDPRVGDDNGGKQLAAQARLAAEPPAGKQACRPHEATTFPTK